MCKTINVWASLERRQYLYRPTSWNRPSSERVKLQCSALLRHHSMYIVPQHSCQLCTLQSPAPPNMSYKRMYPSAVCLNPFYLRTGESLLTKADNYYRWHKYHLWCGFFVSYYAASNLVTPRHRWHHFSLALHSLYQIDGLDSFTVVPKAQNTHLHYSWDSWEHKPST